MRASPLGLGFVPDPPLVMLVLCLLAAQVAARPPFCACGSGLVGVTASACGCPRVIAPPGMEAAVIFLCTSPGSFSGVAVAGFAFVPSHRFDGQENVPAIPMVPKCFVCAGSKAIWNQGLPQAPAHFAPPPRARARADAALSVVTPLRLVAAGGVAFHRDQGRSIAPSSPAPTRLKEYTSLYLCTSVPNSSSFRVAKPPETMMIEPARGPHSSFLGRADGATGRNRLGWRHRSFSVGVMCRPHRVWSVRGRLLHPAAWHRGPI
jgi:hypothetical protein